MKKKRKRSWSWKATRFTYRNEELMEEKTIIAVDVPAGTTAQESEDILNAPSARGYYLVQIVPGAGTSAARAFFKLRVRPEKALKPLNTRTLNWRDRDGKTVEAEAIIRANPDVSVRKLVELLKGVDIRRGQTWVHRTKTRIQTEPAR